MYIMNYINNNVVNTLSPTELDNLKGTTSNIQTQLNQISPNVGTVVPVNSVIANNDSLNVLANKTQGQITNILSNTSIVSTTGTQTLTNKTLTDPTLTNNILKSSTGNNVTIPNSVDTLVNLNSVQTLTNKTLTDCTANTQVSTDNSTKVATTAFVKSVTSGTSTYNGISYMTLTSPFNLPASATINDVCYVTIPADGTYEFTMCVYSTCNVSNGIYLWLANSSNTVYPNSQFNPINMSVQSTGVGYNISRNVILSSLTANTIVKMQVQNGNQTSTGCFLYNTTTGKTFLNYKLLGTVGTDMSLYALKTDVTSTFNGTSYYNGSEVQLTSSEFQLCSVIIPITGTYELTYDIYYYTEQSSWQAGGYLKKNSEVLPNSGTISGYYGNTTVSFVDTLTKSLIVQLNTNDNIYLIASQKPGGAAPNTGTTTQTTAWNYPKIAAGGLTSSTTRLTFKLLGSVPTDMSSYVLKSDINNNINVGTVVPVNSVIANNDSLNVLANKTQGQINNILSNGSIVSTTGTQTLTNKTLTDCTANTQVSTDNSTKVATTAFVKSVASSGTSTYNDIAYMSATSPLAIPGNTTIQEICNITIPVNGTYEFEMCVYCSYGNSIIFFLTDNNNVRYTNSEFMPFNSVALSSGVYINCSRNYTISGLTAGTVIKMRVQNADSLFSQTVSANSKVYNNSIGKTYLAYKLLGTVATDLSLYALKSDLPSTSGYNGTYSGTSYWTGGQDQLTSSELLVCNVIIPVSGTYELNYDIYYTANIYWQGGGYLKNGSVKIPYSSTMFIHYNNSSYVSQSTTVSKSIIVYLNGGSVINLIASNRPGGDDTNTGTVPSGGTNYYPYICHSNLTSSCSRLSFKLLGFVPTDMSLFALKSDIIQTSKYNNTVYYNGNDIYLNNNTGESSILSIIIPITGTYELSYNAYMGRNYEDGVNPWFSVSAGCLLRYGDGSLVQNSSTVYTFRSVSSSPAMGASMGVNLNKSIILTLSANTSISLIVAAIPNGSIANIDTSGGDCNLYSSSYKGSSTFLSYKLLGTTPTDMSLYALKSDIIQTSTYNGIDYYNGTSDVSLNFNDNLVCTIKIPITGTYELTYNLFLWGGGSCSGGGYLRYGDGSLVNNSSSYCTIATGNATTLTRSVILTIQANTYIKLYAAYRPGGNTTNTGVSPYESLTSMLLVKNSNNVSSSNLSYKLLGSVPTDMSLYALKSDVSSGSTYSSIVYYGGTGGGPYTDDRLLLTITIPITGKYELYYTIYLMSKSSADQGGGGYLQKNGTKIDYSSNYTRFFNNSGLLIFENTVTKNIIVSLNAGDVITLWITPRPGTTYETAPTQYYIMSGTLTGSCTSLSYKLLGSVPTDMSLYALKSDIVQTSTYNGTSYYNWTGSAQVLSSDILVCSITIPITGTYELNYNLFTYNSSSSQIGGYLKYASGTIVYGSTSVNATNATNSMTTLSKSLIITLSANTTISLYASPTPGTVPFNSGTFNTGYLVPSTYTGSTSNLSYKLLGTTPTDMSNVALKTDLINYASMRTGTVYVGDIYTATSNLTNVSGAIKSAQKRPTLNTFDNYIDIFYDDKGFIPIIFPTIINNTTSSNVSYGNDISVPILITISSTSATFYLEKLSSAGALSIWLQVLLISPNVSDSGQLPNQQLNDPVILNNKVISSTGKNITLPDSIDTLVNLNSNQTLTNKTLTTPIISSIKTVGNKTLLLPEVNDTIATVSNVNVGTLVPVNSAIVSNDTLNVMANKTQGQINNINNNINVGTVVPVNSVITNNDTLNVLANKTQGQITNILSNTSIVSTTGTQTLTNKTLTDCTANTQLTTDNTTKLATTAYVKNLLTTPNTYVGTQQASASSFSLTTTYQDIASITIPVAGTYEINMSAIVSNDTGNNIISCILYNSTTSTDVANSLFSSQLYNGPNRLINTLSKSLIIENITISTVYKLRAKVSNSGSYTSYVLNDATNGYTYLSYKMLGLTTNVPLSNSWGIIGTLPLTITFSDYTLNFATGAQNLQIKKAATTTIYYGGLMGYTGGLQQYYKSETLTANTYTSIFFASNSYPSVAGMNLNGTITDETNTYNLQIICITPSKFSMSVQKVI